MKGASLEKKWLEGYRNLYMSRDLFDIIIVNFGLENIMNKAFFPAALLAASSFASAATLVVQWADPTPAGPAYVPAYSAEYRINGGVATLISGLATPAVNTTITAVAGNTVEVRYRAVNVVVPANPLNGNFTPWYVAAPAAAPSDQQAPTFILFAY